MPKSYEHDTIKHTLTLYLSIVPPPPSPTAVVKSELEEPFGTWRDLLPLYTHVFMNKKLCNDDTDITIITTYKITVLTIIQCEMGNAILLL